MNSLAEIKPAFAQLMSRGSGKLPPHLNTYRLAKRYAPLTPDKYHEVLLDAGAEGRAFRAIITTAAPVKKLMINSVSHFTLSYEGTLSQGLGNNHFAALAEAATFRVFDPQLPPWNKKASFSSYVRRRLSKIEEFRSRYFLSSPNPADVVLAPWTCSCCFETQYLDYLKSVFDLQSQGSLLIIRILARDLGPVSVQLSNSPFLAWMAAAGFQPVWLLGFDNVRHDNNLSPAGPVTGRSSALFPLSEGDVIRNVQELIPQLSTAAMQDDCPMENFSFSYMFNLYLVFQRKQQMDRAAIKPVLSEAIQWEDDHVLERRSHYQNNINQLLADFHSANLIQ